MNLMVGRYMNTFALLEAGVDEAIGKLLGIADLENQILVRNIEFGRKIYILKSVFDLNGGSPEATALLNRIEKASVVRNTVAHTMFVPTAGGIKFLKVAARSRLQFPDTFFSDQEFAALTRDMVHLKNEIDEMVAPMSKVPASSLSLILGVPVNPPV